MMIFKRILLAALLIVLTLPQVNAEEVYYSPFEKFDFRSGDFSVVGKVGGQLFVYRGSNEGFFLDAYNDAMEKQATVILDFFPEKIYETRFIPYSDKMIVLFQSVESNHVIQYAALLDGKGLLVKGPIKLKEEKAGIFGPNRDYFSSAVSEDRNSIYIYGPTVKGSELQLEGIWLDDNLNITKRSTARFKADNNLSTGVAHLANDGTVFFPAYTPTGSRDYADQVWLLELPVGGTRFAPRELPLNNLYAGATYMKLDEISKRVYVGGFYSEKKNGNYDGVLYAYYDIASQTYENRKAIPFDNRIAGATGERNANRAFNDYAIRDMIIKNDGGFVLVAEEFFITTRNNYAGPGFGYYSYYYSPMMGSSMREYNYNDIMAISYDGNGEREWYSFIRKQQYSQEDGGLFSSYTLVNTGGALGFLFNDFGTNNSALTLASMDANGAVDMKRIDRTKKADFLVRYGKQVAARELVMPCLTRKEIGFAKIAF